MVQKSCTTRDGPKTLEMMGFQLPGTYQLVSRISSINSILHPWMNTHNFFQTFSLPRALINEGLEIKPWKVPWWEMITTCLDERRSCIAWRSEFAGQITFEKHNIIGMSQIFWCFSNCLCCFCFRFPWFHDVCSIVFLNNCLASFLHLNSIYMILEQRRPTIQESATKTKRDVCKVGWSRDVYEEIQVKQMLAMLDLR